MPRSHLGILIATILIMSPLRLCAEDVDVEALTAKVRKSVVVVHVTGRTGAREGLGTGFVVGKGLIATNLHVVGQARPITIETADGKKHDVIEIHASDKKNDLAVIRIKDESLPVLLLGDATKVKDGQTIIAVGNPRGLKHSVVKGVISGVRDVDDRKMIQLAIPVERGNSGGPVVDSEGRVLGVLTLKSLVTDNLGYASQIHHLKPLLKKPNPVPMSAWLTIGALDKEEWQPMLGARWRQRAGRIIAEEYGTGFGGRSFCLSNQKPPELPYEVAVTVKLDDERGAAGLIFHADGGDRHYGFYPSGGKLRLTRFDGATVYTWKILENFGTKHYRPGDWNRIKVRLEKGCILCFVNGHRVVESRDDVFTKGQVGLAKFRNTVAEFKQFQAAKKIDSVVIADDVRTRIQKSISMMSEAKLPSRELLMKLSKEGPASLRVLRAEAKKLERQAERLHQLARQVHEKQVQAELVKLLGYEEEKIDLVHSALLIAKLDNEELAIPTYLRQMDRMEKKLNEKIKKDTDEKSKLEALNDYFIKERGFHGSRLDYYNRSNSYLNEVLDDREGLPITLAIVYLELGRRIGLKIEGVGLPGHFVVRHVPAKGEPVLIDVFEGAKVMTRKEAEATVLAISGRKLEERHLQTVRKRDVITRMLYNVLNVAEQQEDFTGMLRYLDTLIAVDPKSPGERGMRAAVRYRLEDVDGALEDVDWLLEKKPEGLDLERVRQFRQRLLESR